MTASRIPQNILFACDFSDTASLAMGDAVELARRAGARLTVVYGDEFLPPIALSEAFVQTYIESLPATRRALEARLSEWTKKLVPASIPCHTLVVEARPVDAIVSTASRIGADLIVTGSHGRTGFRRALLGSVAEGVLHHADRPVLTVRPSNGRAVARPYRRIVCPVNFSPVAHDAVDWAGSFSALLDAELLVVNVIEPDGVGVAHDANSLNRLREWLPAAVRQSCKVAEIALKRNPAEQILDFADHFEADLLVIGAQHRRFRDATVIGTTTQRVVRYARCPVLTVVRAAVGQNHEHEWRDEANAAHPAAY